MSTNQENLLKDETLEAREPQTEMNQHLEQALKEGDLAATDEHSSVPQTGTDLEENTVSSVPRSMDPPKDSDFPQTDSESTKKRRGRKKSAAAAGECRQYGVGY